MAQATTISLSKFTASVQSAVKAAVQRHPKIAVDPPRAISEAYLIRGIPVPDGILRNVSLAEMQSFADDVAGGVAAAHPEAFAAAGAASSRPHHPGALISVGGHVLLGFAPMPQTVIFEQ